MHQPGIKETSPGKHIMPHEDEDYGDSSSQPSVNAPMYGGESRTGSSLKTQPKYARWAHLMQSQLEMERPPRDGDLQVWPLPRALSTYVYVQVHRPRWTPLGENHERWFWDRANEAALRRIKSRLFSDAPDLAIEYPEQVPDARAR